MHKEETLDSCGNIEPQAQPAVSRAAAETRICGGEPQTARSEGDANSRENLEPGAPPSNTAPANYITTPEPTKILRFGVDSLYLSYPGQLGSDWEQRLTGLKLVAQSQDESQEAKAQVKIGEHLFEVKAKGGQRFSFVLVDNCFHIQLSGCHSTALPLAYVQCSSELLTTLSVQEVVEKLNPIINTFGLVKGAPQISRVDLFVDFTSSVVMDSWDSSAWITRAHNIASYSLNRRFSGWSIGMGGEIGARLYDKTLELAKSKNDYLKPLWMLAGWDGERPV